MLSVSERRRRLIVWLKVLVLFTSLGVLTLVLRWVNISRNRVKVSPLATTSPEFANLSSFAPRLAPSKLSSKLTTGLLKTCSARRIARRYGAFSVRRRRRRADSLLTQFLDLTDKENPFFFYTP